ncbi:unnamed protein product [Mytilus coruscus]|uniref:Uncharacterized protein n=1 Tax=Mytilus coruscus TaxID=42192 RepID=A0A6J8EQ15_MYTCO|nr:unnamed protein product [Mytilus coruscus]
MFSDIRKEVDSWLKTLAEVFSIDMGNSINDIHVFNTDETVPNHIDNRQNSEDSINDIHESNTGETVPKQIDNGHNSEDSINDIHVSTNLDKSTKDRIQTYLYDVQGGTLEKVDDAPLKGIGSSQGQINDDHYAKDKHTSLNQSTKFEETPIPGSYITVTKLNNKTDYDVLMLHDSICRDIDIQRLLKNTDRKSTNRTTYTLRAVHQFCCEDLSHATTTILHVGINRENS